MNTIEQDKVSSARVILAGINYLISCANDSRLTKIAHIMHLAANDICNAIEDGELSDNELSMLMDHNMFAVIDFLYKYAAIKDENIKEQLLEAMEKTYRSALELN